MSKDYARSLDRVHHKILADLVAMPENSFCADCSMRGARGPPPTLLRTQRVAAPPPPPPPRRCRR